MSQNTLIEKIRSDAAAEVAKIKADGQAEVEAIQRETEAEVKALTEKHTVALNKKKEQLELVAISRAKQTGNIAVQQAKRDQIDELFITVTNELTKQVADEYVVFFVKHAKAVLPKEVNVTAVQAPASRQEETSKILAQLGLSGPVEASSDIKSGLVVVAEDGVYDITLGRLISEKRAELEMMVVNKVAA